MVAQPEPMVTGDAVVLDVQIAQLPVRALSRADRPDGGLHRLHHRLHAVGGRRCRISTTRCRRRCSSSSRCWRIVGYPVVFEMATRGRSLGKMALGLRVVSDDGGPERFRQALFRALSGFIEIWMFAGGPAVDLQHAVVEGQADRRRVRGHHGDQRARAEDGPPPLDAAVAGVVGVVAAAVRVAARAGRAGPPVPLAGKSAGARDARSDGAPHLRRGGRADFAATAGVAPPPLVLAAVLAERHRRELARLRPSAPAAWPASSHWTGGTTPDRLRDAAGRIHQPRLVGHRCPTMGQMC